MLLKVCPKCKEEKEISEYQKNRAAKDGLQYHCKTCRSAIDGRAAKRFYDRERYHLNKDGYREYYYQRAYRFSVAEYNRLQKEQGYVCAVCKQPCSTGKRLAVDHCHNTGAVRGLLCSKCNRALGYLNDDPVIIENLLAYLKGTLHGT